MAIRIPWSDQEAAILLHALIDVIENRVERKAAVSAVSKELRELAISNGIKIDDKFRNENGIALQMSKLEYVFTRGASGLSVETGWYFKIVDLYKNYPKQFESLLKETAEMSSNTSKTMQDQYFVWLSKRVSPAQLSELYLVYDEIEKYFLSRKVLKSPLFQTVDIKVLTEIRNTIEGNRFFRVTHRRSLSKMSSAIRYYISFVKETFGAVQPKHEAKNLAKMEDATEGNSLPFDLERKTISRTGAETKEAAVSISQAQGNKRTDIAKPLQVKHTVLIDNQDEQNEGGIETVNLSDNERIYAFTTPVSFTYYNDKSSVKSWRELYIRCVAALLKDYPFVIKGIRGSAIIGRGRIDISDLVQSSIMASPKKVSDDVYVETNYSATDLMNRLRQLLILCEVDFGNLQISFRRTPSHHRVPATIASEASSSQFEYDTDVKKKFVNWMLVNGMAKATTNGYLSSLKQVNEFAKKKDILNESIFFISSVSELKNLQDYLNADVEFVTYNAEQHNRFSAALRKFIEYRIADGNGTDEYIQQSKQEHIAISAAAAKNTVVSVPPEIASNYTVLLRDEFPDGFRQNIIHVKKFMQLYEERFGEIAATRDDLLDQLRQIGTVRDERIYPRQNNDQKTLTDKIFNAISIVFQNGGTCVYLSAIMDRFRQQLGEQLNIYNEDALQAILLERNSSKYLFRYGYICESAEKADPSYDVLRFMQSHHEPLNYGEIQSALWYLPMDKIKHTLVSTASLVNVGQETYFYAPNLPINSNELQTFIRVMDEEISSKGFLVGKDLKMLIDTYCPSTAIDTAGLKDWAIRNCLGYILRDHFEFTGALISQKEHPISIADAYKEFCRQHETLTLDQLKEFSTEVNERINWHAVLTIMVRVSPNNMINANKIHFNIEATDAVLDALCTGNYMPLKEITLYLHFPPIEVPWNVFVLECYLQRYSRRFKAIQPKITQSGVYGVISRKGSMFQTYEEVITDILARNDTWENKDSAVAYLISRGLQARTKLTKANEIMRNALLLRKEIENNKK